VVKIYTRTGDSGETSLFGGGRVAKDHARLDAYGTVDELNAYLGWFVSLNTHEDLATLVREIQSDLFDLGSHLATPSEAEKARTVLPPLEQGRVSALEEAIDRLEEELEPLRTFVLPGGDQVSAVLQVARTVCRRAERAVVAAHAVNAPDLDPLVLTFLNRLSDLLFVMARTVNRRAGVSEPEWHPRRPDSR
jgi:cob(I)alamin adenosyltransferase